MTKLEINLIDIRAWISDYIPLFYVDVITYPCHNLDVGLAYIS